MAEQISEDELVRWERRIVGYPPVQQVADAWWDMMSRLITAYRAQAAEIAQLKARGVTERAIYARADRYTMAGGAAKDIVRLLKSLGLLIEDAPEKIYGVEVPKDLPEYTVKVSEEDDPLKVNMREQPHNWYEEMLARKHNALVDLVRTHGAQIGHCFDMDRERIYGVDVPPADQIPVMEIKAGEVDLLKLDPKHTVCANNWMVAVENLQIAHNSLVDNTRREFKMNSERSVALEAGLQALRNELIGG